jgi:hypothetical protein
LQGCARPEQPGHGLPDQLEEIAHRRDYRLIRRRSTLFWVYGRYRYALFAPKGTPKEIIGRLNAATVQAAEKWWPLIKEFGIKAE